MDKRINILLLFSLALLITTVNFISNINFAIIINLIFGSLFYLTYIKTNKVYFNMDLDYFQNGDFSFLLIISLPFLLKKINNLYSLPLIIILFFFYQIFYKSVLLSTRKKNFYTGVLFNLISISLIITFFNKNIIKSFDHLFKTWENIYSVNYPFIYIFLGFISFGTLILQYKMKSKLKHYSAGAKYFSETNYTYQKFSFALALFKGIYGTIAILLLSFFGGIAQYFPKKNTPWNDLFLLSLIIIYSQTLLLLSSFINFKYLMIGSIIFSYILSLQKIKAKGSFYD